MPCIVTPDARDSGSESRRVLLPFNLFKVKTSLVVFLHGPSNLYLPAPDIPILSVSIFTRLFASRASGDVGGFPGSLKAFVDAESGASITRAQLLHFALSFAHGLKHNPNTSRFAKRGDTVLIYSPNSLAWPVVLFGSVAAGLRCTLANSAYTTKELGFQYEDSGAKLIFTTEEGLSVVREMLAERGIVKNDADKRIIVLGNDLRWAGGPSTPQSRATDGLMKLEDFLNKGKLATRKSLKVQWPTKRSIYAIGTTGKPKGVETTHQNMTTLLDIVAPVFPPLKTEVDIMLGILPFYHIYGVAKLLHFPFSQVTTSLVVPPVLVTLVRHPAVDEYDLSSVEVLFSGAAPLAHSLVKSVKERLLAKRGGRGVLAVTQGFTDNHMLPVEDADRKMGSIGILLPSLEVVSWKTRRATKMLLRVNRESWISEQSYGDKNAITPDGWFKTGDVAVRDKDGYYYIVDRRKELIKYKGFQVPPAELEYVLLTHPDIADAAVIGLESVNEATELPRAYVVHANPATLKTAKAKVEFANSVVKWMETQVARHKRLRGGVGVVEAIPKSAAGKILRRELRELAKQEAARGDLGAEVKAKL
ncbi:AMP binding protein [Mycena leptocephala]|nr:AMP binding protein [Mycena leptocephala]